MPTEIGDTVVAYSKTKQAALYFPHVVAIPSILYGESLFRALELQSRGENWNANVQSLLESELPAGKHATRLLPPHLANDSKFVRLLHKVSLWDGLHSSISSLLEEFVGSSGGIEKWKSEIAEVTKQQMGVNLFHEQSLDTTYKALMTRYKLEDLPAVVPDAWTLMNEGSPTDAENSEFRLTLLDVGLIDTTTASWDKIMAFRQDNESQKKLHRLRRFFSKNYGGKSMTFIEDDLHDRLEDHESALRKFGFDKKSTIFEAVVSSKWLQGSLAGAGLVACFGNNAAAWASGLTAVLFEVGNTAVKIRRKNFEFKELIAQHPLGYIITANETLGKST